MPPEPPKPVKKWRPCDHPQGWVTVETKTDGLVIYYPPPRPVLTFDQWFPQVIDIAPDPNPNPYASC